MKVQERDELLGVLMDRFEKNMHRHRGIAWVEVRARLRSNPDAGGSLLEMEATGGSQM